MRTHLRRSLDSHLRSFTSLVILFTILYPTLVAWAQDTGSGSAGFTISSVNGNVVVKRADGSAEQVRPGTTLGVGDELSSVGKSQATINLNSPSGTSGSGGSGSGASLIVFSNTTIGVRSTPTTSPTGSAGSGSGAGGFYVADLSKGVVLANTPPASNAPIQITHERVGALAQLNQGSMAMAADEGLGSLAVACDGTTSQVFFPYADMRVPCENNVVRTLSNTGGIDDSRNDSGSLVNSAVGAASAQSVQGTGNQGAGVVAPIPGGAANNQNNKDDKNQQQQQPATPPGGAQPCNSTTVSGGAGVTTTNHDLGRTSGTFTFTWDAFSIPDRFQVTYQGTPLLDTGNVSGPGSHALTYSGASTIVTVTVTGSTSGTAWQYVVNCPT